MSAPLIKIRSLRKSYLEGDTTRCIFQHFDLDIERGEFIALLGRSGSGKSTLLNLVAGIDLPDSGQIHVEEKEITALTEWERTRFRRTRMGFIFQFFNLIPTLTVAENVLLPLELNRLNTPDHRQRVFTLLDRVGLGKRRNSFPESLSGGEQQRLAMVRALAHEPSVLLADEPTGNLDGETGDQVLELLLSLHRQANTTVLMVTHSRDIATRADRMLYLEAGQIQETTA
jgi:putative ABC transport system ATP-binding protein